MASVSRTGRWGQIAQAKLGKREVNGKPVCVGEPVVGVFLLRGYACQSTPPTPRSPDRHLFQSSLPTKGSITLLISLETKVC
ncbi:hypothetical protein I79_004598 [Cricetulus griseus]|uniref:Uncharacterized protein n=1 Tax=Cricetulus griseus TaxID=10029 RepID=G3H2Z3_CRIGR|nr:hypothetical protein I79_004598 [Cricetulus griseus]